ncbi:MAG: hypothetical protein ABSA93_36585 [Streptosporangiaceae bacterium]|jgi:hypothetical protein
MFSRTLPLLALPAAVLALAGCGSSSPQSQPAAGTTAAATAVPAGMVTTSVGAYTANELREALLTRINGVAPAIAAEAGQYGSLPEVKATKGSMKDVVVSPASCEAATLTGFNSTTFAHTPAAVTTFRVGSNGVSEVLMSPSSSAATAALGRAVPAGCAHYHATVNGKTFSYEVKESSVSGTGSQARVLNVKAVGYPQVDVWSLVYRGSGLVGAITIVGPDASEAAVRQLAEQAYKYATTRLS